MTPSNNSSALLGHFNHHCNLFSSYNSDLHHIQRPSTSKSLPDLPGYFCTIGPSQPQLAESESFTEIVKPCQGRGQTFEHGAVIASLYPSPPHTSSQPKQSVPLPSNEDLACPIPHFGGVLDSPMIYKHEALRCVAPLSPPPTAPTPTQALPPTEHDLLSTVEHGDYHEAPQAGDGHLATVSAHAANAVQLLSPLSPEWETNQMSDMPSPESSKDSVLLSSPRLLPISPGSFDYLEYCADGPSCERPFLPLLDIPDRFPHSDDSWGDYLPPSMDMDFGGFKGLPMVSSPPASPQPSILKLDDDIVFDEPFLDQSQLFPHPSSPSIHSIRPLSFDLDDDIDSYQHPSSPSRRSFSSLPALDFQDDEVFDTPLSPGHMMLSLPGADTDDDLIPADLAPASYNPSIDDFPISPSSKRSLLLLDDPNDVPPPRSPSPENFDLDPALISECSDPDLHRLCELREKSQAAERAARQLEAQLLEQGSVHMRAEARRVRKREKERSREISALLRLKLSERGVDVAPVDEQQRLTRSPSRKVISSMAQLVARMMFRRHDTFRPLANRKTSFSSSASDTRSSPLARSSLPLDSVDQQASWSDDDGTCPMLLDSPASQLVIPSGPDF